VKSRDGMRLRLKLRKISRVQEWNETSHAQQVSVQEFPVLSNNIVYLYIPSITLVLAARRGWPGCCTLRGASFY